MKKVIFCLSMAMGILGCSPKGEAPQQQPVAEARIVEETAPAPEPDVPALHKELFDKYSRYQEKTIRDRRFKHPDIVSLIEKLEAPFNKKIAGTSIENREIYEITYGNGPVKVLLWSQMHGDEATATMALMDIFNFLGADDEYNELRAYLQRELTLVFLPLLNPDGADRFQRRNALGIDINRDAQRLQCPESQILKRTRDNWDADWGFNLHDQGRFYGAGKAPKTATLSFLAPAFNEAKDINEVRGNAMRLIGWMNPLVQEYLPGQVGRYDDEFEPRAFGDNITKWGTSTILIECGGMPNDPDKQYIRKVHFAALLAAFEAIAGKRYQDTDLAAYEQIPFNESGAFHDVILREVQIEKKGKWYTVDVGYQRREVSYDGNRKYYYSTEISDMGDLSIFHAYEDFDGAGYKAVPGKLYPKTIASVAELKSLDIVGLLQQGYTAVRMGKLPEKNSYSRFPLQLLDGKREVDSVILPGRNPALVVKKGDKVRAVAVNGFLFDLEKDSRQIERLQEQVK